MDSAEKIKIRDVFSKEEIRWLTKKNNLVAGFHLILRILLHIILLAFVLFLIREGKLIPALLCFYINAMIWQFLGYAGIGHELYHATVFTNRKTNLFLYKLFSYLTWNNPSYFTRSHWFHHRNTFDKNDVEVFRTFNTSFESIFRLLFFDYVRFFKKLVYAFANAAGYEAYFSGIKFKLVKITQENKVICIDALRMLLVNTSLVVGAYFASGSLLFSLLLFITPFTASALNTAIALAQHVGLEKNRDHGNLFH